MNNIAAISYFSHLLKQPRHLSSSLRFFTTVNTPGQRRVPMLSHLKTEEEVFANISQFV